MAVSATLESGMIYPLILIANASTGVSSVALDGYFGIPTSSYKRFTGEILAGATYHSLLPVMGIASTLIIVRVTLGLAIHDEKSCKETFTRDLGIATDPEMRHRRDVAETEL
ncbi:hypothetical protein PM082_011357 [Marasmius tenuissimus]|nr:hypothetical protein PM082_011357 [Marasmius tenuissimus]